MSPRLFDRKGTSANDAHLFLADIFHDPSRLVPLMMRLKVAPFSPGEVATLWLSGAKTVEWWMTANDAPRGSDPRHVFIARKADGSVVEERTQYGSGGGLVPAQHTHYR